jgi:hypothetical protein
MSPDDMSDRRGFGNRKQRRAQAAQKRVTRVSTHRSGGRRVSYYGFSNRVDAAAIEAVKKNDAAINTVDDDDGDWFEVNPGRDLCLRPAADAELAVDELLRPAENSGLVAYVLVKQIEPGVRVRIPFKMHPLHRPELFSENACATLLAELEDNNPRITEAIEDTRLTALMMGRD